MNNQTGTKNKNTTLLLCIFGGVLGLHNFYTGKIGKGVLYLFTGGLFGIGVIIDIIHIVFDKFTDNEGKLLFSQGTFSPTQDEIDRENQIIAQNKAIITQLQTQITKLQSDSSSLQQKADAALKKQQTETKKLARIKELYQAKAEAEYLIFNKTQKITSDFDKEVKKMIESENSNL